MALSTAQGFIGAGDLYIQPVGGVLTQVGNATKLAIKPNSTIKEQKSRKRDSYGQSLASVALADPSQVSITLETVNRANLLLAFLGTDGSYSQTSGTVSDEAVTAVLDGWVQLGAEDLGSTIVLTNSAASTTYVEGTDYEVNRRLGMLLCKSTGTITEAQSLKIDYTRNAFTGAAIRGSTQAQIRAYVMMDGINKVDDSIGVLKVWEAVLTPASEFDFLKDDWNTIELTGSLTTPVGKTEPYKFFQR